MTKDTIFDLASLTKSLATATAVLQLFEHGRVKIDDSVQTYLPNFNTANDPRRARVTIRMLLTHTSGLAGDLSLDAPWGLDRADKAEGIHRALNARVEFGPGEINDGTVRGSWSAMRTTRRRLLRPRYLLAQLLHGYLRQGWRPGIPSPAVHQP